MRIDNRILLPFVMPFVVLFMLRLVWWVAGGTLDPNAAAFTAFMFGTFGGVGSMIFLFIAEIDIGGFTIGRRSNNE